MISDNNVVGCCRLQRVVYVRWVNTGTWWRWLPVSWFLPVRLLWLTWGYTCVATACSARLRRASSPSSAPRSSSLAYRLQYWISVMETTSKRTLRVKRITSYGSLCWFIVIVAKSTRHRPSAILMQFRHFWRFKKSSCCWSFIYFWACIFFLHFLPESST